MTSPPPMDAPAATGIAGKLKAYGDLVAFSHTIFAMPFAGSAVIMALREKHVPLTVARGVAMVVCMVAARTAAMAFNRWADRDIDADNPRTKLRPIQAGRVKPNEAFALVVLSSAIFLGAASTLGFWPAVLSVPVLGVLLGYSYAKRFTPWAHAWLGVALALAPGGAWLGMGAEPNAGIITLMVGVVTWLFGFDVLYSLQDEAFDRARGLRSVPARFGTKGALWLSGIAHMITAACFLGTGLLLHRGPAFFVGAIGATGCLAYEHWLVGPGRLDKIDKAFFDMNAYVGVAFFSCTLADHFLTKAV